LRFRDNWSRGDILRIENVTPTIRLFEIDPGDDFRAWTPGSHIRVGVTVAGRADVRTYSLIDLGTRDRNYRIAVRRVEDGLGGSLHMWSLQAGDVLEISQPHNHFELSRYATSYTLVAGGVGITPLISMAHALRGSDRQVRLIYGVRSREEAAFADLLKGWLGDRMELHIDAESGPLNMAEITCNIDPDGELYVCGPIRMLEAAREAWEKAEHPPGLLRYETFAASGHYPTQEFVAVLPRFNLEVKVLPHQSLLSALADAGVEVMSDCQRGECGLCVVDVISADSAIDHRDVFFSERQKGENRKLCACVSRVAGGRVEIDTAYRGH
jgi:ferredoxin-NADP reductase